MPRSIIVYFTRATATLARAVRNAGGTTRCYFSTARDETKCRYCYEIGGVTTPAVVAALDAIDLEPKNDSWRREALVAWALADPGTYCDEDAWETAKRLSADINDDSAYAELKAFLLSEAGGRTE